MTDLFQFDEGPVTSSLIGAQILIFVIDELARVCIGKADETLTRKLPTVKGPCSALATSENSSRNGWFAVRPNPANPKTLISFSNLASSHKQTAILHGAGR